MKKILLSFLFCFLLVGVASSAGIVNVLLYCEDIDAPENTHWKSKVPRLADGEVIRDFRLIASQGDKRFFHCIMEKNAQSIRVKNWIDNTWNPENPGNEILYWIGVTADEAYTKLWQDVPNRAIAERVLRYPVATTCEGNPCTIMVSVYEAENTYGETIVPSNIRKPMTFWTGEK